MPVKNSKLEGKRFGRLVVISDSGRRDGGGGIMWECKCDCGNTHYASTSNLKNGNIQSCCCLQRELSSQRRIASKLPQKICSVDGCNNTTEKGGGGLCGMHYMRFKRYGDVNYITPLETARIRCREAQPNLNCCKPHVYKKKLGRHEHRVVMEEHVGRKLTSEELVHHIDGDTHNNSIDNLMLTNHSGHAKIHFTKHHGEKK